MLKKFLFFQSTLGLFITVSSGVLISPLIFPIIFWVFSSFIAFFHFTNFRVFRHPFVSCFHITSDFYYIFSRVFISPTFFGMTVFCQVLRFCFIALRVLRIRERLFFTFGRFLPYTPSPHLPQYREQYGFQRTFFSLRRFLTYTPSRHLTQPAFINASLGAGSSSLKVAGPPTEVGNTHPVHLFV